VPTTLDNNSQGSDIQLSLFTQQALNCVRVTITHPTETALFVFGFAHLWAKYVRGFNPGVHCQHALKGPLSALIKTKTTPTRTPLSLDETGSYDSLYICGVASGPVSGRRANNLHLPLEYRPGARFVHATYNGYLLDVENAVILPTPELPTGWNGLSDSYTRCRNFRFCVHRFGYPKTSGFADALLGPRQDDSIGERCETGIVCGPLDAGLDTHNPAEGNGP
jgi:hypothetical protein